jgi:hypothetical protein
VIHGTTNKEQSWCDQPLTGGGLSWSVYADTVDCIDCLRAAVQHSCAKCKERKRVARESGTV